MSSSTVSQYKDEVKESAQSLGEVVKKPAKKVAGGAKKVLKSGLRPFIKTLVAPLVSSKTGLAGLESTGRGFTIEDIARLQQATDISKTVTRVSDVLRPEQKTKTSYLGTPSFAGVSEEDVDALYGTFLARQSFLQRQRQQFKSN